MNKKLDNISFEEILSVDFIEKILAYDTFPKETIDFISKNILSKILPIRLGHYRITFIRTLKYQIELLTKMHIVRLKIKGYLKLKNIHYKKNKISIGNIIVNILNDCENISHYIEITKNNITDATEMCKTDTYLDFLYLQLYLKSKNNIFIIYDIENAMNLYQNTIKFDKKLSNEGLKEYNSYTRRILETEINILYKLKKQITDIFISTSTKNGYKIFNNPSIILPSSITRYSHFSYFGKRLKPYCYIYTISSIESLFYASIYQISLSNKAVSICSFKECGKYFITKKRKDEHFCTLTCKNKFYKKMNQSTSSTEVRKIIKQITDFLKRPKIKNGEKLLQNDRLNAFSKFKNDLNKKRQSLSDNELEKWLQNQHTKYLKKFSKKKI